MGKKKLSDFTGYSKEQVFETVKFAAGRDESKSLFVVANRIFEIPEYSCSINISKEEGVTHFLQKWTQKFINGWKNRPSQRKSNPIGTQHDTLLDEIISARLPTVADDMEKIRFGHRLSMSAENIAGSLLEEYVATKLLKYNWHCCWGETMRSIDFCNEDGQLMQIKNSDNSENSSSKTVRDGTPIGHWFRRFSRTGKTNWHTLNNMVGIIDYEDKLTEDSFKIFVREVVNKNPGSVFLEENSPWYGDQKSES